MTTEELRARYIAHLPEAERVAAIAGTIRDADAAKARAATYVMEFMHAKDMLASAERQRDAYRSAIETSDNNEDLCGAGGRVLTYTPSGEEVVYDKGGHPLIRTGNNGTQRWCDQVGDWCAGHDCFCETMLFS